MLVKYIFHENTFTDLSCLVYFCLVLNITTAATSRVYPFQNMFAARLTRLASRPHALRPCTRQPRGCHFNWSWPFVMLRVTPQLSTLPRPCFDCVELAVHPRTRTRSGACMSDTYMRITPTLTSADVNPLTESWAALWLELATTARRPPTRDSANRHLQTCLFHSPPSRPSACLAPVRTSTKGLPFELKRNDCDGSSIYQRLFIFFPM